jgi:PiT family inorganic phosphate transporter
MATYVIGIILVALVFDFFNGVKDAANSIATVVATKVLTPRKAVIWAAFFNFVAAFGFGTHVAGTIGKGLVKPEFVDPNVVLAALIAAIAWTVICLRKGLPISVSHALIGALAGVVLVKGGLGALAWSGIGKVALFIVVSPLVGFVLGLGIMIALFWILRNRTPRGVDKYFRVLQLVSAAAYSLAHGLNDAQKTMGIIVLLLLSVPSLQHYATRNGDPASSQIAWWIILSCHAAISLGTYMGGWKVVHTLGHRVTRLQPVGGFAAETGGAISILAASIMGIPVSTTHTITGAIFGVGITKRMFAVRWAVGADIVTAWVLTMPAAGLMAIIVYTLMRVLIIG